MVILTRLTTESMGFALQSVRTNKLRTLLSLFGITIGIFSIISVFTVVDSLEISVHNSLNQLGSNTIYVQKWPWNAAGEYPWWKYMNRPEPNQRDLDEIRRRSQLADASCLQTSISRRVEHGSTSVNYTSILGVSDDCDRIQSFDIAQGRYFTNFGPPPAIASLSLAIKLPNNYSAKMPRQWAKSSKLMATNSAWWAFSAKRATT